MTQNAFTWTQDSAGNFYIGEVDTTADVRQLRRHKENDADGGCAWQRDQVNNYNYPGCSPSVRTYNYSYLNEGSYTSRYIFNRLTSATVTDGTNNLTWPQGLRWLGADRLRHPARMGQQLRQRHDARQCHQHNGRVGE